MAKYALCGENGAGKSTLMKILSGVYPYGTYSGDIIIDGKEQRFNNIASSEAAGIAIINQELSVVKQLTIGENIFLVMSQIDMELSIGISYTTKQKNGCQR